VGVKQGSRGRAVQGASPPGRSSPQIGVAELVRSLGTLALLATAFAVSGARAAVAVPEPNLAQLVPPNYHVLKVLHVRLSGQSEPEVVVSSVGPLNRWELHPADLQVFSWDALAYRWNVVFDAQRVSYESAPLISSRAVVRVGPIASVRFLPAAGSDLVYAVSKYEGGRVHTDLVVVDFLDGQAGIAYLWSGELGSSFRVTGFWGRQMLVATVPYRTAVDPSSQPVRTYQFTVGLRAGFLRVLRDDRPWAGLFVTGTDQSTAAPIGSPRSHLRVVGVVPNSPAAAAFHVGDVIVGLKGPRTTRKHEPLGPALIDDIATQHAGDRISFAVRRGDHYLRLPLKLGSRIDPSATAAAPSLDARVALL
jgi:hypothetical protein